MTSFSLKKLRCGASVAVLTAGMLFSAQASGEVLFSENFDYAAGNLYPQGGWLQGAQQNSPIKVTDVKLTYAGFGSGKSVELNPGEELSAQDVYHACVPRDASTQAVTPITEGDIYVAFLMNAKSVTARNYFFTLLTTNYSGALTDGKAASVGGYVTALPSTTEGKFKLGFDKNSFNPGADYQTADLDLNKTYLVVLHYGIVKGTNNDTFEAWINPTAEKPAATITAQTSKADMSKGFVGVGIFQQGNRAYDIHVGAVRVATAWKDLFDGQGGGGGDEPDKAAISATLGGVPAENFALYQYQKYDATVTVKATGITEDISVSGFGEALKPAVTTIPAAEALSEGGYTLGVTIDATRGTEINETLVLTSGDTQGTVPVKVSVQPTSTMMNFRFAPSTQEYETYSFSANAWVTYVDASQKKLYLEDAVGGVVVDYASMTGLEQAPFKEGDKIKNLYLMAGVPMQNIPQFYLCGYYVPEGVSYGSLVSEGSFRSPMSTTLDNLITSPENYINRLVKVEDLSFASAGQALTTGGAAVTSGESTGRVRAFAGSTAVGVTLPETATVTGISTSMGAAILSVRKAEDISAPEAEPSLEFSTTVLVDPAEYYPVNVETPFATLKVTATNMPNATSLWVGGTNRAAFILDTEEIPAGTGEYTVNITFKPTSTGRNSAMLNFDANPTELSKTTSMACLAYDPDNLPTFSVDAAGLTEFRAAPGTTKEQTLSITSAGLLDYGSIRVLGQSGGAFRIASTTFLKNGTTNLKVTFAPTAEGTYQETIEFSTPKAETVTVPLQGICSGDAPIEDKQGDELSFDTTNPLKKYSTDFTGAGDNNKPLSLAGWKNVAVDGTRAFWSYSSEGNTMAKVTAYDSKMAADAGTPAEMLLMSPALDFAGSAARLLSFRVKGENLTDDMTDEFSVLLIDPESPEDNGRYFVMDGIDIPATADASGEWREFIVDLDAVPVPDTFFIGFHYLSTRGRNTTAVYYVDDFSWGDETIPFIRVDKQTAVAPGTTKVGETKLIDTFTVTGLNLSEKIALGFEGAHKDHFGLSHTELPAEGGEFSVNYTPQEEGEHAVYVTLKSEGAPDTYIAVGGTSEGTTGIEGVEAEGAAETMYFTLQGVRVHKPASGSLYIRVSDGKGAKILK